MKEPAERTHYQLLDVAAGASAEEIRAAYHRRARHSSTKELRARLDEALRVLSDPSLRAVYDRSLGLASNGQASHSTLPSYSVAYVAKPPQKDGARELELAPEIAQEAAIGIAEAAMAQVSAKIREKPKARSKPPQISPDTEFNGELLRRVRQSRGYSLAQLAERTRIAVRHLENVEADHYDALPATVYLRGILMNMARELGLDALRVSKSYLGLVAQRKK